MIKFANIQEIAIEFVYCRQQKIITFYLTDDNSGAPRAREARAERSTMGKKIW